MTRPPDDAALRARVAAAERLLERTRRELAVLEDEIRAIEDGAGRPGPGSGPVAGSGPAIAPAGALLSEIEVYRRRLEARYASTSWRLTRPLRALSRRFRGGGTEPELPPPPPSAAIASWRAETLSRGRMPLSVTRPGRCAPADRDRRRIALVVATSPEGAAGGAELFYRELADTLERAGCTVETVAVPVDERSFETIQDAYRDVEGLDLDGFDCVISTKAPTYAVFHPNHIVYLVHTVRVFYDMSEPSPDALRARQRDWIHRADAEAIGRARARFAIGREVADRLREASGIAANVLHPGRDQTGFRTEGYGDYFFLPGRLHPWKRVDLAIRAVLASKLPMRLVIAGDGECEASLRTLAGGDARITFLGRVSDDEVRQHYAACLAVPFLPLREDYGYVTIEAFASGKAVVTCRDSGEPARIVAHGADGLVADPTVPAIRQALERLWRDRALAGSLGAAARERAKDFTWEATAAALLAAAFDEPAAEPEPSRIRVAVLDMQPITPPLGGGRARLLGLYGDLGPGFETRYVGSFDWPGEARRSERLTPRLTETVVPLSEAHHAAAREATAGAAGRTVIDALFGQHARLSPDYLAAVEDAVSSADVVVFSHPWVAPLLAPSRLAGKCVVYDAQNCEGRLKAQLFDRSVPADADVVDYVVACESALGARADLVIACSEEDRAAFVADYGWDRTRIHVVPNGAFTSDVTAPGADERRAARASLGLPDDLVVAIFVGSDFAPNVEAAAFIAGPLAREDPAIRFVIAGGCGDKLADVDANCWRTGTLSEDAKRLWLAAADIALNPVVSGSGTNVKMFDYMAHGLPVLATPVGARGIVAGTEAGIVVAGRDGFAAALSSLAARPPAFRRGLGRANRALVARDFDWSTIAARLGRIFRRAVHAEAAASPLRVAPRPTMGLRCGIGEYTRKLVAALASDGATNLVMTAFNDGAVPDVAALPQPAAIAWKQDNVHWRYSEILPVASEALAEFGADMLVSSTTRGS